jgi:hypothetical protein
VLEACILPYILLDMLPCTHLNSIDYYIFP